MRHIFICLFIVFWGIQGFSQDESEGTFFINNFQPREYNGHVQNWDLAVDSRGVLYAGNGDGLLEYDGVGWQLYEVPGELTVRSVNIDKNGKIYAGLDGDFGIFLPDSKGFLTFKSFLPLIDSAFTVFKDVWDVFFVQDDVYFRANEYLFKYSDDSVTVFQPDEIFNGGFVLNNRVFVQDKGHDLHEIIEDTTKKVKFPGYSIDKRLYGSASYKNNKKLLLFEDSLVLFDPDKKNQPIKNFNSEISNYLNEFSGYSIHQINSDLYAIGTKLDGGIIVINSEGDIIRKINKNTGLQPGSVYGLVSDNQNNLWVALSNGISMVEISTPLTYWNEKNGLTGAVEDIIQFNDTYYIATHQGTFYLDGRNAYRIEGTEAQCWEFLNVNFPGMSHEKLLVSTQNGIMEIDQNHRQTICYEENIYTINQSEYRENSVFGGNDKGIILLQYNNEDWEECQKIRGLTAEIRSIAEISENELWLTTYRQGAIWVKLSDDATSVIDKKIYQRDKGFKSLKNIMVYEVDKELVFFSDKGIYRYNSSKDSFVADTLFADYFDVNERGVYSFCQNQSGKILLSGLNNRKDAIVFGEKLDENSYTWKEKPFLRIPEMLVLAVNIDNNGVMWVGGTEGLYRYSPGHFIERDERFNTLIRKVVVREDSVVCYGNSSQILNKNSDTDISEFRYADNNITFHFSSTNYVNPAENKYSYYLEGFSENWSSWKINPIKQYTNLSPGFYTFRVKSESIFGNESGEAKFSFEILPPWYLTLWAYVGYLLVGLLLIYGVVRVYTRNLKTANLRLESLVKRRTEEIEYQKEEILSQSEQLERTNHELEKLSIVARETHNAVLIVSPEGKIDWVNEGFTRLYGYTLEELNNIDTNFFDLSESNEVYSKFQYCLTNKESVIYETLNSTKDHQEIWTQTTLTPILNEENEVVKLIAIDTNINKLKQAEQEIKKQKQFIEKQNFELEKHRNHLEKLVEQKTEDLKRAKEKAEESDRLKSSFLANMSHEIRTPMNAIIGFTSMLHDPDVDKNTREEMISQINLNGYALLNLIDNIIELAKIDANQLEIKEERIDVNKMIESIYEGFFESAKQKKLELKYYIDIKPDFYLLTDAYRIKQVFTNLLDNALKYTEKGQVQFGYKVHKDENKVIFYVEDTGIGISKEKSDVIFQRFTKIEEDKEKLFRGAGLGLTISNLIIEKLQGEIWLNSTPGKGSVFYFSVPYKA